LAEDKDELPKLKDCIHVILYGTKLNKEKLEGKYFHLTETPEFMKKLGLTGVFFSIKYGVISRHLGKDVDHSLSEENWNEMCFAIKKPFAIAKYKEGFRLFTTVKTRGKYVAVGVNVKSVGKGIEVNSICTAFGYNQKDERVDEIIYKAKNSTPEQTALLDGLNSLSLPSVQGSPSLNIT